jgi:Ca2+-binding EF-hand superfamily protein
MNTLKTSLIATLLAISTVSIAYAQAPADAPKGERAQKMHERLKAADTDGDGKISREEANASLPGIAKNFDALDTNKDGSLSKEELAAAGRKQGRGHQMQEHMKAADTNGDGKFSREEANASLPQIARNFDAIDTNKDGFVTKDELRAFHEKNGGRK